MTPTTPRLRRQHGAASEKLAISHLERQGMTLLERNFTCRRGEIDLIMQDRNRIVFVEVRSRHSARCVSPLESIDAAKQRRIINAARYYLMIRNLHERVDCRFDCLGITGSGDDAEITWIADAFPGTGAA